MASPSLDGTSVVATFGTGNSTGLGGALPGLTTAVANDLIVCVVSYENGAAQRNVASVSSAHLTWNLRSKNQGGSTQSVEVWTAKASGTLASEVITVTMDGQTDASAMTAFALQNCATAPFDTNGSLPAKNTGSTAAGSVTGVSTSLADDLLLAVYCGTNNAIPAVDSGWTSITGQVSFHGSAVFAAQLVEFKSVSATQSGLTVNFTGGSGQWAFTVDALTSDVAIKPINFGTIVGA